jgi:hypothetical protein
VFVTAMDAAAFFRGQVQGGEAVYPVGEDAVMTTVRALNHQIGRDQAAFPGSGNRVADDVPALAIGSEMGLGSILSRQVSLISSSPIGSADIGHSGINRIGGVEAEV